MLVILLLPRNELVDGKRIQGPIRGTCLKGISAIARVRGWEMTTSGSQSPVGIMDRDCGIIDIEEPESSLGGGIGDKRPRGTMDQDEIMVSGLNYVSSKFPIYPP